MSPPAGFQLVTSFETVSTAQSAFGAPPQLSEVATYAALSTMIRPCEFAPAGTKSRGGPVSSPFDTSSECSLPSLEIAHTALGTPRPPPGPRAGAAAPRPPGASGPRGGPAGAPARAAAAVIV